MGAGASVEEVDGLVRELDGLMASGKERMYPEGAAPGYLAPGYLATGVTHAERAAVLVGDLLRQVHQNGLSGWVGNYAGAYPAIDLPRRVAALAEAARAADPDAADLVTDTMSAIARMPPPPDPALPWDGDAAASRWEEVGWRDEVWWALRPRLTAFLARAALSASADPFAADLRPWPRAPLDVGPAPAPNGEAARARYPGIAVGLTRDGAGCRFRLPEGEVPDYVTMTGVVSWALRRSGVPLAEIERFRDEMRRDREAMAETVGRWVSVDGNGMAGLEALRAATRPDHPWQSLLGLDRERAGRLRFLFCASSEQAVGLLRSVAGDRSVWHVAHEPDFGRVAVPSTTGAADMLASIAHSLGCDRPAVHECRAVDGEGLCGLLGNATRGGVDEIAVELRGPLRDASALAFVARMAMFGAAIAFVGADAEFKDSLRAAYEDPAVGMRSMGEWGEVALDAVARGPSFGGRVLN